MFTKSAKEKALERARQIFQYLNKHICITQWRDVAFENYGFYDGSGQWSKEDMDNLRERKQPVITINKIKSRVDRLVGMEIQSRSRIGFRSHLASNQEHQLIANALSRYALYTQETLDMPKKDSMKFQDGLITGLGWSNLYRDPFSKKIECDYVNPFNILWDVDDLSPDLSDQQYVCRMRWYPIELAKKLWPKNAKYFQDMFQDFSVDTVRGINGELAARQSKYVDTWGGDRGDANKALVIEVQYKQSKLCFFGTDENGFNVKTFDEEEALRFLSQKDIQEDKAEQHIRVVFCGEQLLEYAPLYPNIPDMGDFSYIPFLNSRRYADGMPDSWLEVLKDPQREINHRRAKLVANLNSKRLFINPAAFPGQNEQQIIHKLQHSSVNIMHGNPAENIFIDSDAAMAPGQFNLVEMASKEFEDVVSMYDDLMGKRTDAVSGIAIQSRQSAAARSQIAKFDDFKYAKKRMGRQLLNLIQGQWADIFLSEVLSPEDSQALLSLAARPDKQGNLEMVNDIRTIPLDIYVEQSADYESSFEENRATLEGILASPNAPMLLQSPKFLEVLGMRNAVELSQEMQEITARMSAPPGGQNQQPIPENNEMQEVMQ